MKSFGSDLCYRSNLGCRANPSAIDQTDRDLRRCRSVKEDSRSTLTRLFAFGGSSIIPVSPSNGPPLILTSWPTLRFEPSRNEPLHVRFIKKSEGFLRLCALVFLGLL